MKTTLSDVMTPFPYTVGADASVETARSLLRAHGVRHLAVVHQSEIVGVISERDINLAIALHDERHSPVVVPVFAVCSKPAYVVDRSEPLPHVLRTMATNRYGCCLVTKNDKLAGIVTTIDACRLLAETLEAEH